MDIEALKEFFFEAALATYAGDGPKIPEGQLPPGFKGYKFFRDKYLYIDQYTVHANGGSFGQTVIWEHNDPVWFMQYHGFCHDRAAARLVKKAMRQAYTERQFCGGRGVKKLQEGELGYGNSFLAHFPKFNGQDWVVRRVNTVETMLFSHWYHGGMLECCHRG